MTSIYEREQRKVERASKKRQDRLNKVVRDVAQTPSGKEFIWEILAMCGIYSNTFTGNSQGAFLEGRRAVGLDILGMLADMDEEFYPNLVLQQQRKQK